MREEPESSALRLQDKTCYRNLIRPPGGSLAPSVSLASLARPVPHRNLFSLKAYRYRGVFGKMPMPKPTTKSAEHMLAKYRGLSPSTRMAKAVAAVLDGEYNQSEAARFFGVNRTKVNLNVKNARAKLDDQAARSAQAQKDRAGTSRHSEGVAHLRALVAGTLGEGEDPEPSAPVQPLVVSGETRRVPPFEEFSRKYFSSLECFDCGVHHDIPDFHIEMMNAIMGPNKRQLINLPPGHSKSTIGTVHSTVYELCRDPNSMTAIVSKSQKLAKKFLYQIAKYLSDPSLYAGCDGNLIDDWGPFHGGDNWSSEQLYIAGRNSADKDPSVSAYGVGGHIYGIRAHRMIMDDIADLENQANVERVQEMLLWCLQDAGTRVGRHGKLIFIGTRVRAGDIYSHLQALPGFEVLRYSCILDDATQTTLWPDHFPYEAAESTRNSMTPDQWQLVFQNVDTPGFGADFPPEVLAACHDPERVLGHYHPNWALVAGLDPAGMGKQAGYTAMILQGIDLETGKRYLVDIVNAKQMKAPDMKAQMVDWADRYPLREFRVEVNGLQGQIFQDQDLLQKLTTRGCRVVPHVTTAHNKFDPAFGIQSLAPYFHNRQISLPTGSLESRNRLRPFTDQLAGWPMARESDMVMAFWFSSLGVADVFRRSAIPMFDPRMKLPDRLARRRRVFDFGEQSVSYPTAEMFDIEQPGRQLHPSASAGEQIRLVNTAGVITLR